MTSAATGFPITDAIFEVAGSGGTGAGVGTEVGAKDAGPGHGIYRIDPGTSGPGGATYRIQVSAPGYVTVVVPNVIVGASSGCPSACNPDVRGSVQVVTPVPLPRDAGADAHDAGHAHGSSSSAMSSSARSSGSTCECDGYSPLPATITVHSAISGSPILDAVFIEVSGASVSDAGVGYELSLTDGGPGDGSYSVDPGDDRSRGESYDIQVSAPGYVSVVLRGVVVGAESHCTCLPNVPATAETVSLTPLDADAGESDAGR